MTDSTNPAAVPDEGAASPRPGRPIIGQPIADIQATARRTGWTEHPPLTFHSPSGGSHLTFTVDDLGVVTSVARVFPEAVDVVERVRHAVERIERETRDGPFCVDCHDAEVGVDTEIVGELVAEVEWLRGVADVLDRLVVDVEENRADARRRGRPGATMFHRGERVGLMVARDLLRGGR